jgi:flagellar motility protein MotE (MotC chaperone)
MVDKPSGQKAGGGPGKPRHDAAERTALARSIFAQLKANPPEGAAAPAGPGRGAGLGLPAATVALGVQPTSIGGIRVVGPAAQAQAAQALIAAKNPTAKPPPPRRVTPDAGKPKAPRRSWQLRPRLLPVTIFVLVLMLGVRIGDSWRVLTRGGSLPDMAPLAAETTPKGKEPAKEPAKPPAKEPGKEPAKPAEPAPGRVAKPDTVDLELVKHLSERREELEGRARTLDQREALMVAAEKRIDQKVAELQSVRAKIQELLKTVDDKQRAQMESLVRIYETMKPKEAARIFEQLEPDVLLGVVERMKEAKTAPILAAMEPAKAKDLTTRLAEQRRLPAVPP